MIFSLYQTFEIKVLPSTLQDPNRPTSNPLPPQSEAFSDYKNVFSAQQLLENVAQQVPNFGTEQVLLSCSIVLTISLEAC